MQRGDVKQAVLGALVPAPAKTSSRMFRVLMIGVFFASAGLTGRALAESPPSVPAPAPTVTSMSPSDVAYPMFGGEYDLDLVGTGLPVDTADQSLRIESYAPILLSPCEPAVRPGGASGTEVATGPTACFEKPEAHNPAPNPDRNHARIKIWNVNGDAAFVLINADGKETAPQTMRFVPFSKLQLQMGAALICAALALILYLLLKDANFGRPGKARVSLGTALFLDSETNTYSLSRFQGMVWLSVLVYCYCYALLCEVFVRFQYQFPTLPANAGEVLGVSAGTIVLSIGATNARGSKGAGPVGPRAADFISNGGIVAPERFQFFVWTVIGAASYMIVLLAKNAAALEPLPLIPKDIVLLSGVSALAYLGGKVVRKPGPILRSAEVNPNPTVVDRPKMLVRLTGENLDRNGRLCIDSTPLDAYAFEVKNFQQAPDTDANSGLCTALDVLLHGGDVLRSGTHQLTITNGDGQFATLDLPADVMTLTDVPIPSGNVVKSIAFSGTNFPSVLKAKWTPSGAAVQAPDPTVTVTSSTAITIELIPGPAGTGTLELTTPKDLIVTKQIQVT